MSETFRNARFWYFKGKSSSIYITRLLINTQITPNQVTLSLLFFNVLVAFFFAMNNYLFSILAIVPFELMIVIDQVDGELARYKKATSLDGLFLDSLSEVIIMPLVFAGVTIGVMQNHFDILVLIFGISAIFFSFYNGIIQYLKHEVIFSKLVECAQGKSPHISIDKSVPIPNEKHTQYKKSFLRNLFRLIFTVIQGANSRYLFLIAAIFSSLDIILIIYGAILPILTAIIMYREVKAGIKPWSFLFKPYFK
ncbi:CDP-alcohol phosphatidyltransferase family protein [Candidatus Woesearchaeota archaeon]|nr:CDP-alcohol phosphatidyltransferase family protein [Candidatus Woesearchaeota archaeon]